MKIFDPFWEFTLYTDLKIDNSLKKYFSMWNSLVKYFSMGIHSLFFSSTKNSSTLQLRRILYWWILIGSIIIQHFFRFLLNTMSKTWHYKLVLLGDTAVGKSCLVVRFVRDEFFEFQEPTIGAAFLTQTVSLDETTVKFEIWDTAGQGKGNFILL